MGFVVSGAMGAPYALIILSTSAVHVLRGNEGWSAMYRAEWHVRHEASVMLLPGASGRSGSSSGSARVRTLGSVASAGALVGAPRSHAPSASATTQSTR